MASPAKDIRAQVQQAHPGAVIIERGKNFIRHRAGKTIIYDGSLGAMHFGENHDQEIDTAWVDAAAPWDKSMVLADYQAFALVDFSSGQIIKYVHPGSGAEIAFQPQQLQYTNNLNQIQAIGDPQAINAQVNDDRLTWPGAFGSGLDFTYETQTNMLAKRLEIQSLAALGEPDQYIIDGGDPVIRLQFIFAVSGDVDIYVGGVKWDKRGESASSEPVQFKQDGQLLWVFNQANVRDAASNEIQGEYRFRKQGNSLFVEIRVPWAWLQSAAFPVIVDPTIDDQISSGYHDASERADGYGFKNYQSIITCNGQTTPSVRWNAGIMFDNLAIDQGDTILTAYVSILPDSPVNDDPYCTIYCEDVDNSNDFGTQEDINGRPRTSASTDWHDSDMGVSWHNSPSLVDEIQEVVNRPGWANGNNLTFLFIGGNVNGNLHWAARDYSSTDCAKVHIEYESTDIAIDLGLGSLVGNGMLLQVIGGYSRMPIGLGIAKSHKTYYEIWLSDQYGTRLALLDTILEMDIIKLINNVGYGSFTLPGDFDQTLLGLDNMIEVWRAPAGGSLILENVYFLRRFEFSNTGGLDVIHVGGPDGMDLINRRIVAYASGTAQAKKTSGDVSAVILDIIRENLGGDATDSDRDLSGLGFSVGSDPPSTVSITGKGISWKPLMRPLTELVAWASSEQGEFIYFYIEPEIQADGSMGFSALVRPGQLKADRSYAKGVPVVFGLEWGNLKDPKLVYDYTKELNYIYGGGSGEKSERNIVGTSDDGRLNASIWNRREGFLDSRNDPDNVANRNHEKLAEFKPVVRFTAELLDTKIFRYGRDWYFGDRVVVNYQGRQIECIIKSVNIEIKRDGTEMITVKVESYLTQLAPGMLQDLP